MGAQPTIFEMTFSYIMRIAGDEQMKKNFVFPLSFVIVLITAFLIAGCGAPSPTPRPTDSAPVSTFEPTVPQRTIFPTSTLVVGETPTLTPTSSAQSLATLTPIRSTASPAAAASVSPTLSNAIAPGLYANAIRLVPVKPVAGTDPVTFYVTFVNATSKPITFKWKVKIWSPDDARNSFGETTALTTEIQPGTTELPAAANWKTNPGSCTPFFVRVYNVNTDITADPIEFRKPDGSAGPQTNFQVCPP